MDRCSSTCSLIRRGSLLAPFLLLILFFYYPLASLAYEFFKREGVSSLCSSLIHRHSEIWEVFSFTIFQAALSTLAALAIGLLGAYWIGTKNFPGKEIIRKLTLLPFVLPPIVVVFAFIQFWGSSGWMTRFLGLFTSSPYPAYSPLYSLWGIILAHAFYNSALTMRIVGGVWEGLDPTLENAARTLGASKFGAFMRVTIRRLAPAVLTSAVLTFLLSATSFVIVLTIGSSPRFTTMEVAIYQAVRAGDMDFSAALGFGSIQLLVGIILFMIMATGHQSKERWVHRDLSTIDGKFQWSLFALWLLVAFVVIIGPLLAYTFDLVASGIPTTQNLLIDNVFWLALRNSLFLAFSSGFFATLCATLIAAFSSQCICTRWKRFLLDVIILLPISVSSVLTSLALLTAFGGTLDFFSGNLLPIVVVHAVVALPFLYQILLPYTAFLKNEILNSARLLGASHFQLAWYVVRPLISRGLLTAFLIGFAFSMGEVGAVMMFYSEKSITLPVLMYQKLGTYNFSDASLIGGIILIISFVCFYRLSLSKKGEFV